MTTYLLMPHIQLVPCDDHLLFYRKAQTSLKLNIKPQKELGELLLNGFGIKQLAQCLNCLNIDAKNLITKLLKHRVICEQKTVKPRFDRLSAYLDDFSDNSLTKLQQSRVLLLGVGGLGSHIFLHLMANGINTTIVDHDIISASNLSRQMLYSIKDVGRLKTEICQEYALKLCNNIKVIHKKIASSLDMKAILTSSHFDLIISTIDDPVWLATQYVVKASKDANVALLRANSRAIGPLYIPGYSSCPLCKSYEESQKIKNSKNIIDAYQHGFKAKRAAAISYELAFVALITIREAIHFLLGQKPKSLEHELCWNKEDFDLEAKYVMGKNCPACKL